MTRNEVIHLMILNEMDFIRRSQALRRRHFNTSIFWKRNQRREIERLNQKENESVE